MKKHALFLLTTLFLSTLTFGQQGGGNNNLCETAAPFCTGTLYSFPAGVNAGTGQPGPSYGCLTTRPNPAWYYMKVANPGNIIIQMHSEPSKDIDFCCWGPFPSQECCGLLTSSKIVSCSYSTLSYETCNIPNGQTGQYYMLVITNFSNQPCNIIFQQTGGTGTTDCSILPPACASNSPICTGQTLQFSAQSVMGATYQWWGPAGFTSSLQNPSIPNATPANSGNYYLSIIVGGQPSSDTSVTNVHVFQPSAHAGNDTTIMNGVSTQLHGHASGGSGSYRYKWSPSSKLINDSVQNPLTVNLFSTQVFTLRITDDSVNCQATDNVTVNIAGGALAVNAIATPETICYGATTELQAIGAGGAGNYTYQWTGPNGFSSTLPNPTVAPGVTSTYQVSAFDGYNTVTAAVTVTVIQLPEANAGTNLSIPFGTYTFLSGSVQNGSNSIFYSWSPAGKLINAGVRNPQTVNLTATTIYSLLVTDLETGCSSANPASVTVEVTGNALNVSPVATPPSICRGDSTVLHAAAGGGNVGHYTYAWSSDPPGFTSAYANPVVFPVVNTVYSVTVTDEFNTTTGSTPVSIYPDPMVLLGPPDTTVCLYDTVTLDAGNPGSSYLWSNGAVERTISFSTTGIGYDSQVYSVEVVNANGCKGQATINVIFTNDACTGIDETAEAGNFILFPNPARDFLRIRQVRYLGETAGVLLSPLGKTLRTFQLSGSEQLSSADIDLAGIPKGIYLVRFSNPLFTQVYKLVIE